MGQSPGKLGGWLFKEEPGHFSFADLQRQRTTLWDGVTNNLARQNLSKVQVGDQCGNKVTRGLLTGSPIC